MRYLLLLPLLTACGAADGPVQFEFALTPPSTLGQTALPVSQPTPADFAAAQARLRGTIATKQLDFVATGLPELSLAGTRYRLVLVLDTHPIRAQSLASRAPHLHSLQERIDLGALTTDALGRAELHLGFDRLELTGGARLELVAPVGEPAAVLEGEVGNLDSTAVLPTTAPDAGTHPH